MGDSLSYLDNLLFVYNQHIFASSLEVFGNLELSSPIFGKCSKALVWLSDKFWGVFGNIGKVVGMIFRKSLKTSHLIKEKTICSLGDLKFLL